MANVFLYLDANILFNILKMMMGLVLYLEFYKFRLSLHSFTVFYVSIILLILYLPFSFTLPLVYSQDNQYIYFIFFVNFFEIQLFREEKVNLFKRTEFQWVFFLLIFLFIILIEIINSSKLGDFQFYMYLAIAILQIIHLWMSYNRNLPPLALSYSVLASVFFLIAEYLYACNILIASQEWHKLSMICVDIIYSIGLFLFIQSFILKD